MSKSLLLTKLYIPPPRPKVVLRPRLIERLNEGLSASRKLTIISAPAGFGKTTLVSEWIASCDRPVAWLSLDEGDNDPARFLAYFISSLQTIAANIGKGMLGALQNPQLPPIEILLTNLVNEITAIPHNYILVLDDYHVIDSKPVDAALAFLLKHLPSQMHLVITTREDPHLPLARLRAKGQLTELRITDLRFTPSEAAEFLNQVMDLNLSAEDITALETRTEGWIAGLQLAALSMQGNQDVTSFIQSFTGSHHFVLDYLIEEVLEQQSESIQTFLLRTSILDRMCGPLCDAVLGSPSASRQATLEYLQHANLFIVPLDNERRWYRYHHLFAELLRQRLYQSDISPTEEGGRVAELHRRASQWYEDNGLDLEAFKHATAANDIERAARLIVGKGMPLYFRGGAVPILKWLESLPTTVKDARPSLWVTYASATLTIGLVTGVEQKVQAAEAALAAALQGGEPDENTRNLIGQIASIRASLAVTQHQAETIIVQSRRALEYLHPKNLPERAGITWKLGYAYHLQGDRAAASQAYTEALSTCEAIGRTVIAMMAAIGLGSIQEVENQLSLAVDTYRRALQLGGDPPPPPACDAHLGLARIFYQWNDLDAAQQHTQQSVLLARQILSTDRSVLCELFLARLMLTKGNVVGAAGILALAYQSAHQNNFVQRIPEVVAAQVLVLLRQGQVAAAAHLAQTHDLPISQARVHLAQGDPSAALAVLEPLRQQMEAKNWVDEQLKIMVLQTVALQAHDEKDKAVQLLGEALALAEPGGFIRLFVDEGEPMAQLLLEAGSQGVNLDYIGKLLAAFEAEVQTSEDKPGLPHAKLLIEQLSERELEVLQLIAQGLSNHVISERLFLALSTVKGHNRIIFDKLHVQNRTEAVARARELGLLQP
jgi:LuxR family maltose regulon positive regulatory protein